MRENPDQEICPFAKTPNVQAKGLGKKPICNEFKTAYSGIRRALLPPGFAFLYPTHQLYAHRDHTEAQPCKHEPWRRVEPSIKQDADDYPDYHGQRRLQRQGEMRPGLSEIAAGVAGIGAVRSRHGRFSDRLLGGRRRIVGSFRCRNFAGVNDPVSRTAFSIEYGAFLYHKAAKLDIGVHDSRSLQQEIAGHAD